MPDSHDELIIHLKNAVLRTPRLIEAFKAVDRIHFVPEKLRDEAYVDHPLPLGHGQTISQPYTVAFMLELLQPRKGEKILDIGSGSAWTTALISHVVGPKNVIGVERIPEIVAFGKKNLKKFGGARIEQATDTLGWPAEAPYDRILVSAAAEKLPEELLTQLKDNGVLVIPIRSSVCKITKYSEDKIEIEEHHGFAFVPLH